MSIYEGLGDFGKTVFLLVFFCAAIYGCTLFYTSVFVNNGAGAAYSNLATQTQMSSTMGLINSTAGSLNEKVQTGGSNQNQNAADVLIGNAYEAVLLLANLPALLVTTISASGTVITSTLGIDVGWFTNLMVMLAIIIAALILFAAALGRKP